MQFQNSTLNKQNRQVAEDFAREIFEIDNVIITMISDDDDTKKFHEFMIESKTIHN